MLKYNSESRKIYNDPTIEEENKYPFCFDFTLSLYRNREDNLLCLFESKNCKVLNKETFFNFLENNDQLEIEIFSVLDIILEYYGKSQQTQLEIFSDYEDENISPELFLNIILKDDSYANMNVFNKINNWFVDNIYKYRQNFNINLNFE